MSRHLVTGGGGFIGSALANRLSADGHLVTAFDRFSRGKRGRLAPDVRVVKGDIRNWGDVSFAWDRYDTVWHLAYVQGTQTFYADPKDVIGVALAGVMNVLRAAELHGPPPEMVLVSSSETYQNPPASYYPTDESVPLSVPDVTNPRYSYGGGKIASELAVFAYRQAGILGRTVVVRPHNVYGPDMGWDHVIPQFARRLVELPAGETGFRIQGSGSESRSFCYIDDAVDGLLVAHEQGRDRNVYHLGNMAEEYTIAGLARLMAEMAGRRIDVVPGALPKGSPTRRWPDTRKLEALGYRPGWSLPLGLAPTLEWYRAHEPVAA